MSCAAGEGGKLLNLLSILAALPTIRRLSFQAFGFASFWPELSLLSTLLASCNPAVCSIEFFESWLPSSSSPTSVASYPRRPLDVLDLSGLTHALVCCNPNNNNAGLKALLHNSRNTLTHLDLSGSAAYHRALNIGFGHLSGNDTALQRAEIRLLRTPDDYSPTTFRQDDWALEVKALVPHLVERRILVIESELYV
ncbi:hypothetical protein B0H14DRAFT_2910893 [Mycena olivaceomarginata]|nr:hypothetical protein B0H14DRAFT_2910893 [Mycena olivaceomarginata]